MAENIEELKKEIEKMKKFVARSQYMLDEGIEIMISIKDRFLLLMNAIKEHKFRKEDAGLAVSEYDERLWEILEEVEKMEEL